MNEKIGRNDPCPCGSGKKYKQCCLSKPASRLRTSKHKITAKWLNAPAVPNLIERTFGGAIASTGKTYEPPKAEKESDEQPENEKEKESL